jgi:hypothetical protein
MKFPSKEQVESLRAQYPIGTRIVLTAEMRDPSPIAAGMRGEVVYVDDCGHLGMKWDNGRSLNVIVGEDSFRKLTVVTDLLKSQIEQVRRGGKANMLDVCAVQYAANEEKLYELVVFIEEHRKEYARYVMTGESEFYEEARQ